MTEKNISVIIPSYNSFKTIAYTLDALLAQPNGLIKEIIVPDSSDDNKTRELLNQYNRGKIKILCIKAMPGPARNFGVANSSAQILAFIDSDAYPADDWAEKIITAHKNGCLIGGGSISYPESQKNMLIPLAQFFLQYNEYANIGESRIKKFVPSVNMFCDRGLFEKIGGFPNIRASEDTLFSILASKIEKVWFMPEIRAYHIFREDLKSFLCNQVILGKYILVYRRITEKHKFYYRGSLPVFFLPGFLLIKLFNITSRVSRGGILLIYRYLISQPFFILGLIFWSIGFIKGVFSDEK